MLKTVTSHDEDENKDETDKASVYPIMAYGVRLTGILKHFHELI